MLTKDKNIIIIIAVTLLLTINGLIITLLVQEIIYKNKYKPNSSVKRCRDEKMASALRELAKDFKLYDSSIRKDDYIKARVISDKLNTYCPIEVGNFLTKVRDQLTKESDRKLKKRLKNVK